MKLLNISPICSSSLVPLLDSIRSCSVSHVTLMRKSSAAAVSSCHILWESNSAYPGLAALHHRGRLLSADKSRAVVAVHRAESDCFCPEMNTLPFIRVLRPAGKTLLKRLRRLGCSQLNPHFGLGIPKESASMGVFIGVYSICCY